MQHVYELVNPHTIKGLLPPICNALGPINFIAFLTENCLKVRKMIDDTDYVRTFRNRYQLKPMPTGSSILKLYSLDSEMASDICVDTV